MGRDKPGFRIQQIVVDDEKDIPARLRVPVQAAVDTEVIGEVVELNQGGPRQGVGKNDVRLQGHEPGDEIPLDQSDIIEFIGPAGAEMPVRPPGGSGEGKEPGPIIKVPIPYTGLQGDAARRAGPEKRPVAVEGI